MDFQKIGERMKEFDSVGRPAIEMFDDAPCYEEAPLVELVQLQDRHVFCDDPEERARIRAEFAEKLTGVKRRENAPARIYLWPEGKAPTITEYTENPGNRFNHGPEFRPYFLEMLLPDDVAPKGAVVCIPGGDQGFCTIYEAYQVCKDFNKRGYQAFILHNRVNHNPWSEQESGVDVARCLRIIRRNAEKYRIDPNNMAVAGFSNGGLTGDNCIRYFSGAQTVADHFPGYQSDELDAFYGAPDTFLCIYGPRFKGSKFDFTNVKYPPTFFAVGKDDFAMDNLNYVYPILIENGVDVEVHTFTGVPHGCAGQSILKGVSPYPTFDLWYDLADHFMQTVYARARK